MSGEEGSTTLETILAMTMLVPLLFAIVGFGDALQRHLGQNSATAQAARLAGQIGGDGPEVRALLEEGLRGAGIDPARSTISVTPGRVGWREPVTVRVETRHPLPIPFVGGFELVLRSQFTGRGEVNR